MTNFDRVAGVYQALEYVALGRTLEAARFRYLERLRDCRQVLIVGEGDGRFLERLLLAAPGASVRCVDGSAAMLARAERRLDPVSRARVTFECGDVRVADIPARAYDAVVTMFVLDCLSPGDVTRVVQRLAGGLRREGVWLFADFSIPPRGWRRLRAVLWVRFLYAFFRWQAGLTVGVLPPSEEILHEAGFRLLDSTTFQHGLVKAALYSRVQSQLQVLSSPRVSVDMPTLDCR